MTSFTRTALPWIVALGFAGPGCLSTDPTGESQAELDLKANQKLFAQTPRMSYAFTWQQDCFCGEDTTRPIRITVSGTNLVTAVYVSDQQPVSDVVRGGLRTVLGVFDLIKMMLDRDADEVTVAYDPALHYPTSVLIDVVRTASDEEIALHLSEFETLSP